MSTKYPGGFVTKSPVAPTNLAASGIWTVEQAMQYLLAGTWPIAPSPYIDDVFGSIAYTGTSASQTLTTGLNIAGRGGAVWIKSRSANSTPPVVYDTLRGVGKSLQPANTTVQGTVTGVSNFGTTDFTVTGSDSLTNESAQSYIAWNYLQRPKFFQILEYTGNGSTQTISHSLGSAPGCIIVRDYLNSTTWYVYHRSAGATKYMRLNSPGGTTTSGIWNNTSPTSTEFTVSDVLSNNSNTKYIAYLFAHNAGGFGLSGSENAITCNEVFVNTTDPIDVYLGYEPQWVMVVPLSTSDALWGVFDSTRMLNAWTFNVLTAKTARVGWSDTSLESTGYDYAAYATATGFKFIATGYSAGYNFAFIAIRKPMAPPTSGTSVFLPTATSAASGTAFPIGFKSDMTWLRIRTAGYQTMVTDRLRNYSNTYNGGVSTTGFQWYMITTDTAADTTVEVPILYKVYNTGAFVGNQAGGFSSVIYNFARAAGFFDEVTYYGTGAATTQAHNLTVAPELMIVKKRNSTGLWATYVASVGNTSRMSVNTAFAPDADVTYWNNTSPTSSVFTVGSNTAVNSAGGTFVAYLFATLAGVSKVGSYTGTGATQTINCGFTGGARFVLIKRTDTTGNWLVWDTARGMTAGTNPYSVLNTTAAETNANNVYTVTTGFQLVSADANINASGGTYIFLAIA